MPANLSTIDKHNRTPTAAVVGEPHGPTHYRAELSQLTENSTFLFNRLAKIFGDYQLIESCDPTADTIRITAHGRTTGDFVRLESIGGTIPAGLVETTGYYAYVVDADTLKLKNTPGAAFAINFTTAGTGTMYLYSQVDAFAALIAPAVTMGSQVMSKGFSLRDLLGYVASTLGATFTGSLRFDSAEPAARIIDRDTGTLSGSANGSFGIGARVYYQATPAAQRDHEVDDTDAEDNDEIEVRRPAAGNFSVILHRPGAPGAIVTLPALTCCSATLRRVGGVWTLKSYSGACTPGADAG